ncbi:hypothetical protein GLOIN_2v1475899 [Rhizophagus clarus]|uniref:Uncharacterized protein n=1 Tax=Rhizophagus clarus TaxID=94130 RepID=A0A8H3QBV3_9GLOM|nr:hypothetical protein GLOIN_2v1475899 [Rhizophagus clarus]
MSEVKFKSARKSLLTQIYWTGGYHKENTTEEGKAEKKSMEEDTRKIVVLSGSVSSPARLFVAGTLIRSIYVWSNYLDVGVGLDVTASHISDVVVEPWQHLQPGQQRVLPGPGSVPQPRMIIEVRRNESIGNLHSLSREYFSASTQTNLI